MDEYGQIGAAARGLAQSGLALEAVVRGLQAAFPDAGVNAIAATLYHENYSAAAVATALYSDDGAGLSVEEVAEALSDVPGLSTADVADALYFAGGLEMDAAKTAGVLYFSDSLDLSAEEVAKALRDGLDLPFGRVGQALIEGCGLSLIEASEAIQAISAQEEPDLSR